MLSLGRGRGFIRGFDFISPKKSDGEEKRFRKFSFKPKRDSWEAREMTGFFHRADLGSSLREITTSFLSFKTDPTVKTLDIVKHLFEASLLSIEIMRLYNL